MLTKQTGRVTTWQMLLIVFLAALGLLAGVLLNADLSKKQALNPDDLDATLFKQPRLISAFSLNDQNNQHFTQENFKNKWSLVFFGFTHCPHICPMTMTTLNKVYQQLTQKKLGQPQVVFVSIDPERDNSKRLHDYVQSFNPQFVGLTGTDEALEKLTRQMSVLYMKVNRAMANEPAANYAIDHSGAVLLVNPRGELQAIFSMPHDANAIVNDFTLIKQHFIA